NVSTTWSCSSSRRRPRCYESPSALSATLPAGSGVAEFARRLLELLTGNKVRGTHLVELTASTIRGVALGVVGVAAIQALLIGVGFFAMGGALVHGGLYRHLGG